jgi:hypothetical protein
MTGNRLPTKTGLDYLCLTCPLPTCRDTSPDCLIQIERTRRTDEKTRVENGELILVLPEETPKERQLREMREKGLQRRRAS